VLAATDCVSSPRRALDTRHPSPPPDRPIPRYSVSPGLRHEVLPRHPRPWRSRPLRQRGCGPADGPQAVEGPRERVPGPSSLGRCGLRAARGGRHAVGVSARRSQCLVRSHDAIQALNTLTVLRAENAENPLGSSMSGGLRRHSRPFRHFPPASTGSTTVSARPASAPVNVRLTLCAKTTATWRCGSMVSPVVAFVCQSVLTSHNWLQR
jgi:hypothetical protein